MLNKYVYTFLKLYTDIVIFKFKFWECYIFNNTLETYL